MASCPLTLDANPSIYSYPNLARILVVGPCEDRRGPRGPRDLRRTGNDIVFINTKFCLVDRCVFFINVLQRSSILPLAYRST